MVALNAQTHSAHGLTPIPPQRSLAHFCLHVRSVFTQTKSKAQCFGRTSRIGTGDLASIFCCALFVPRRLLVPHELWRASAIGWSHMAGADVGASIRAFPDASLACAPAANQQTKKRENAPQHHQLANCRRPFCRFSKHDNQLPTPRAHRDRINSKTPPWPDGSTQVLPAALAGLGWLGSAERVTASRLPRSVSSFFQLIG